MNHLEAAHGIVMLPNTKTMQALRMPELVQDHLMAHVRLEYLYPHVHVPLRTMNPF